MFVRDFLWGEGTPWGGAIFWLRCARGMVPRRVIIDRSYGGGGIGGWLQQCCFGAVYGNSLSLSGVCDDRGQLPQEGAMY